MMRIRLATVAALFLGTSSFADGPFDPNNVDLSCTSRTAIHCRERAAQACQSEAQDVCSSYDFDGAVLFRDGTCSRLGNGGWVYHAHYKCV